MCNHDASEPGSNPRAGGMSRTLRDLCPHVFERVAMICIDDSDLDAVGLLREPPASCPVPPAVWSRVLLQRLHRCEPRRLAAALGDRLDLRFAAEVLAVRGAEPSDIQERADHALGRGDGPALPGLLWATATDPREEVRLIAARLGFSIHLIACRDFVEAR